LVCLESQYETAHAALFRDASHVASVLLDPDGATPDEVTRKLSPEAKARLLGLLKLLGSVVDANEDGNIDLVEQERLASMMRLSAITSVGGSEQPARSPRRTADELLELAGRSGILALVEPLRTTLVQRIEAGKRFKEMPSRATLSYYAPRQLWHEKGGSGSILMLGMTPTDGILRVQLCMTRLSQANAPQSRAWANLQAYLADHPADQSLRWDANWTLIELKTPDQVEDFLGVLTEVVPFA